MECEVSNEREMREEENKHAEDFAQQIDGHRQRLQKFAYYLTRDEEDSKDLVQETFCRAYLYRHKFRADTNLSAWLCTIMRNIFFNMRKKQSVRQQMHTFELTSVEQVSFKSAFCTDNLAPNAFLSEDLRSALSTTDIALRKPFLMYFYGFKYREIAEQMSLPIGTVKHRIHLAKKSLQSTIKQLHHLG